jgi:glycosyltransferase involved in cell wall biosynthesis
MVPLGVDTNRFSPGDGNRADVFRILFVGRVTQQKGLSYLLRAFRDARLPRTELVLVGKPCGDAAQLARTFGAKVFGGVTREGLPALYRSADVCVLPSLADGFGLAALEAMACGVPTIVSTNTFADDVITDGHDGFVIPIRDASALAERLHELYRDRTLRIDIGAEARRTAERFSWQDYGRRLAEVVSAYADLRRQG